MSTIINLCSNGMVPTKKLTPHVPITPQEIIETVLRCAELGASIAHLHARDEDGRPTWKKEIFAKIIEGIRNKNDKIVLCVTTSGRNWSDFERRSECLELTGDLKPEMASATLGSMNFINSESVNSPTMIELLVKKMEEKGIKPELEVFELGMLNKAKHLLNKGIIKDTKPYFNILLGSLGTAPLDPTTFAAFQAILPSNAYWSLSGIGQFQLSANVLALCFGGGARIGLEDNIYLDYKTRTLATNEQLVERVVSIAKIMNVPISTPEETRSILGL